MNTAYPKLRPIELRPYLHQGNQFVLLRDPLALSDKMLIIPQEITAVLALCDGTRDSHAISASLAIRMGLRLTPQEIEGMLAALDDALLLDNERSREAQQKALEAYRALPERPPSCAGQVYPVEADDLRHLLATYLDGISENAPLGINPAHVRGLVSPHIDYARGGAVYAQVWSRARQAIAAADLAIIFGTDHNGGKEPFTLTRQNYATPLGTIPTAQEAVNTLAKAIGEEAAFSSELYHSIEHSIELAAVWLQYLRLEQGLEMTEIVPVLTGSFNHLANNALGPTQHPTVKIFLSALKEVTQGKRPLLVAAGDLAHVGPAFGGVPVDLVFRARLKAADDELIDKMCAGDAEGFYQAIQCTNDSNNVCGVAPIYLVMRALSPLRGERVAYDLCPADNTGTSLVSICGVLFE